MVCELTLACAEVRSVILIKELAWGADRIGSLLVVGAAKELKATGNSVIEGHRPTFRSNVINCKRFKNFELCSTLAMVFSY